MHVQEIRLQQVLEGTKQYRVPLYQRTYSWTPKQLGRLWADVVDLSEARMSEPHATHFTGSLVLSTGGIGPGGAEFLVVDGQQRLTTLSTLICALRDHIRKTDPGSPEKVARLHETYLSDRFKHGDDRLKLLPTQADRDAFRAVVDSSISDDMRSGVIDAYRFFRARLVEVDDPDDPQDIDRITAAVMDGLVFVAITASHDDNVYRIFESLNNTGMKLTQGDLLRNYIFMRLGSRGEGVYTSVWLPMQTLLSSSDLEALFWMDMTWSDPEAKQGDIYSLQEDRLSRLTDAQVEEEVWRYARLAQLLAMVRDPSRASNESIRRRLERLQQWGSTAAEPLVLRILHEADQGATTEDTARALEILESYLVRRLLVNAPPSGLSRILLRAADELDPDDLSASLHRYLSKGRKFYATDRQISEAVVSKPFYYAGRPTQRKTLLAWLEALEAGKEPASLDKATIEHVMPQTLTPAWHDSISVDLGEYGSVEDVHEAYLHTLANLTLSGYNSELSNSPFEVKRELLAESNIALNSSIARNARWGRAEIEQRGAALAARITGTWIGPLADAETVESGIAWKIATAAVEAIPRGRWTTYGDVATVAGTHPVPLGVFLGKIEIPNAWRVLQAAGTVSPGFHWNPSSPYEGQDPHQVLAEEGVAFDMDGRADAGQRLTAQDLALLVGVELEGGGDLASGDEGSEETENAYLAQLADRFAPSTVHGVIEIVKSWRSFGGYVSFGTSNDVGAFLHVREPGSTSHIWPLVIYSSGSVEVVFQWLSNRPPFDDIELRDEFRTRLNLARGVDIHSSKLATRPSFSVEVLADVSDRTKVIESLEWFIEVVGEYDRLTQSAPTADVIEFTLDGQNRKLSREDVVEAVQGHIPSHIVTYWVEIEGVRWPVKQALSVALGVEPTRFQSWDSRRHLRALGFHIGSSSDERDPNSLSEVWTVEDLRKFITSGTATSVTIGKVMDVLATRPGTWMSTSEVVTATGVPRANVKGAFAALTRQLRSHFPSHAWMLSFAWGTHLGREYVAEAHYRLTTEQAEQWKEARAASPAGE